MQVLIERIEIIIFHPCILIPMVAHLWNTSHCNEFQERRSMSPVAQHISVQLNEIIEEEKNTEKSVKVVQKNVEDGKDVFDPDDSCSVLNTVLNIINDKFEQEHLDKAARLHNDGPISQSIVDWVPGNMYPITGVPTTTNLAHQLWAIWFSMRRWVWDSDMPGVLVANEMGNGEIFTLLAAPIIWNLPTEKVVMRWWLSVLWGNTLEEWVNTVQNNYPGSIGKE